MYCTGGQVREGGEFGRRVRREKGRGEKRGPGSHLTHPPAEYWLWEEREVTQLLAVVEELRKEEKIGREGWEEGTGIPLLTPPPPS